MTTKKSSGKEAKKKNAGFRFIPRIWSFTIGALIFGLLFFVLLTIGFMGSMPNIKQLENPKNALSSEVLSEDGKLLGKYYLQNRTKISYNDIAKSTVDALVSTEDERFYEHSGIDARAIARALKGMGKDGGASTLTQQLAKNLFSEKPKSKVMRVVQKFKEWIIAVRLEKRYSKDEILTMY
ncbi:MAG: transglycosylase domain-containing protein, partial [Bacteroidia bacterium]|nr:transglycosylase domain-containing protein [Bacteroidia bacterium]